MKLCFIYDHYLKVEGRAARGPPPVCGEGVVPSFVRDQRLPAENEHKALSEYFGDLYLSIFRLFEKLDIQNYFNALLHFYYNFPTNSDT